MYFGYTFISLWFNMNYELSETTQERCFYFKHFKESDSRLGWNLPLIVKGLSEPWMNRASHWKWTDEDWESDASGKLSFR